MLALFERQQQLLLRFVCVLSFLPFREASGEEGEENFSVDHRALQVPHLTTDDDDDMCKQPPNIRQQPNAGG